jgi:hypothetical protein
MFTRPHCHYRQPQFFEELVPDELPVRLGLGRQLNDGPRLPPPLPDVNPGYLAVAVPLHRRLEKIRSCGAMSPEARTGAPRPASIRFTAVDPNALTSSAAIAP